MFYWTRVLEFEPIIQKLKYLILSFKAWIDIGNFRDYLFSVAFITVFKSITISGLANCHDIS